MLFSQHPHAKGACEEALLTGDLLRAVIAPLLEIPAERENRTACAPAHTQAVSCPFLRYHRVQRGASVLPATRLTLSKSYLDSRTTIFTG
jgi:hypothetical protein